MAEKITYKIDVDASDATSEFKKVGKAADQAGDDVGKAFSKGAEQAGRDITALMSKIDKLGSGRAANIVLANNFKQIEADLVDLTMKLDKLDADDAEVDVTIANIAQLQGDLDQVEAKIKELNAAEATIDVNVDTGNARREIDNVTASSQKSRNAMANMWGNAAQDLGALTGVAGSAGVALGQLAEGAADAANDGERMSSVLKGVAGSAGPIAGIALVTGLAAKAWGDYQAAQAEVQRQTDDVAKSLIELEGIVERINDTLGAQAEVGDFGDKLLSSLTLTDEKIVDILSAANQLKIPFTEVGDIIAGFGEKGDLEGFNLLVADLQERFQLTRDDAIGLAEAIGQAGTNWGSMRANISANTSLSQDWVTANKDILELYGQIGQAAKDTDINEAAKQYLETLKLTDIGLRQIADARDRLADQGIVDPSEIQVVAEIGRGVEEVNAGLERMRANLPAQIQMWESIAQAQQDAADAVGEDQAAAVVKFGEAFDAASQQVDEFNTKTAETQQAMRALDLTMQSADFKVAGVEAATDALGEFFRTADTGGERFGGIAAAEQMADFEAAIDGVGEAAKRVADEQGFANMFDLSDPDNRDVLDALSQLSTAIIPQIGQAWEDADGNATVYRQNMSDLADTIKNRLVNEFGIAEDQVDHFLRTLGLTPENVETSIKIAGDAEAIAQLQILQGLMTSLPPDIQREVSLKVLAGDPQGAVDDVSAYLLLHPPSGEIHLDPSSAIATVNQLKTLVALTQFVGTLRLQGSGTVNTGGGSVGTTSVGTTSVGTLAAPEATPFDEPTMTPLTGTPTVSFGVPVSYASAPAPSITTHNHVTISAAVIGSRFDVQRAVTKALRQSRRLAGART